MLHGKLSCYTETLAGSAQHFTQFLRDTVSYFSIFSVFHSRCSYSPLSLDNLDT